MTTPKRARSRTTPAGTVGALRTRILTSDGHGPTVLLIHGFSDSADSWRTVMEQLSDHGHCSVAVDLPHHGRAERPTTTDFFPIIDDFIAAAVNQFDTGEGVVLVGNSVGALGVLRAAQRPEQPLIAAVAIAPAGITTPRWMSAIHRTRRISKPLVNAANIQILRGTVTAPALISAGFARVVARGQLNTTARQQYASHWGPGDLRRLLMVGGQAIDELIDPNVLPPRPFAIPVIAAWGEHDWICPRRGAQSLRHTHPNVDIHILPDTGHCPQYDQPHLVSDLITTALSRCARSTTRAAAHTPQHDNVST